MQLHSEVLQEKLSEIPKPSHEAFQRWRNSPTGEYFQKLLIIRHQQSIEAIADINNGSSDLDLQDLYRYQSIPAFIGEILDDIDDLCGEEEKDV